MISSGKIFEKDFRDSIPEYCYIHRLRDSAQSYNNSSNTKYSWNNECDFFIFDSHTHLFYALECKSTKYKSMSVQLNKDDDSSKMIKYHQIESLLKLSFYDGIIAGLLLNFRDENNNSERLYFIDIKDFEQMMYLIKKISFNEMDLILNNAIKISGNKKRVHYNWDIDTFLKLNSENKAK